MAAQTLSEIEFYQWMNESLVRLESQLQIVFNEFRLLRTALETPKTQNSSPPTGAIKPPSLTVAWPPPIATPKPAQPPPTPSAPNTKPVSVPTKFQPLIPPLSIQTNSDISSHNPCKPIISLTPLQQKSPRSRSTSLILSHIFLNMDSIAKCHLNSISWWCPTPGTSPSPSHGNCIYNNLVTTSNCFSLVSREEVDKGEAEKREWRPPWCLILETAPNTTVRVEWRPPWFTPSRIRIFDLRTSRVQVGWIDVCLIQSTHEVPTKSMHL
ncbi:hypothetical protein Hanom_Chr03g00189281 [Helianthus anomalus]